MYQKTDLMTYSWPSGVKKRKEKIDGIKYWRRWKVIWKWPLCVGATLLHLRPYRSCLWGTIPEPGLFPQLWTLGWSPAGFSLSDYLIDVNLPRGQGGIGIYSCNPLHRRMAHISAPQHNPPHILLLVFLLSVYVFSFRHPPSWGPPPYGIVVGAGGKQYSQISSGPDEADREAVKRNIICIDALGT